MPKDTKTQDEIPVLGHVIPLNAHWVATVKEDGSILLQHLSKVVIGGTSEVVDLLTTEHHKTNIHTTLQALDPERLAVRTILLQPDGSIISDVDSISPKGELTSACYQVISPTIESAYRYFSRTSGKNNW